YRLVAIGKDSRAGTADDKGINLSGLITAIVGQESQVTLTPTKAIKLGTFIEIVAPARLTDVVGNHLGSTATNTAGVAFTTIRARGTSLKYLDAQKDSVSLKLSRAGTMDLTLGATGDAQSLQLTGTTAASTLTGSVKKAKKGGDGKTTIASVTGAAGIH